MVVYLRLQHAARDVAGDGHPVVGGMEELLCRALWWEGRTDKASANISLVNHGTENSRDRASERKAGLFP